MLKDVSMALFPIFPHIWAVNHHMMLILTLDEPELDAFPQSFPFLGKMLNL